MCVYLREKKSETEGERRRKRMGHADISVYMPAYLYVDVSVHLKSIRKLR